MKTVVLVGDKVNAQRFTDEIKKSVNMQGNTCSILGQSIRVFYEANAGKLINKRGGAIVVVTDNNDKIPQSIVNHLDQLPSDITLTYSQAKIAPHKFIVQEVINNEKIKPDVPSPVSKFFGSLFGNSNRETANKTRPLRMQL
jgi:hypothetical protein